MPTNTEDTGLP